MNKYQEALDYIVANSCPGGVSCSDCNINNICNNLVKDKIDKIQELVDKETPMKPIFDGSGYSTCDKVQYICPNCNQIMLRQVCITKHKPNYCYKCGQRLDWND